jgi:hypothetical protein
MPVSGPLEQVVADLVDMLTPYLQRLDFSDPIDGMRH